jgi:hypothetical protein
MGHPARKLSLPPPLRVLRPEDLATPGARRTGRRGRILPFPYRPPLASITYVSGSTGIATEVSALGSGTGVAPSWGQTTGSNSLLILSLTWAGNPGTITVPSPFSGNALAGSPWNNGSTCYTALYLAEGASPQSGSVSVTWANSVAAACGTLFEFSGVATSGAQDGSTVTNSGSSTSPASASFTPGNSTDLVLTFLSQGGFAIQAPTFSSPTPGGFSLVGANHIAQGINPKANCGSGLVYAIGPGTSAVSPGCTSTLSETWFAVTLAMSAAGGGTAVETWVRRNVTEFRSRDGGELLLP